MLTFDYWCLLQSSAVRSESFIVHSQEDKIQLLLVQFGFYTLNKNAYSLVPVCYQKEQDFNYQSIKSLPVFHGNRSKRSYFYSYSAF